MDKNTPRQDIPTTAPTPARVALNVLALCFALALVGRGLGESFTVFLKPISEDFGWDRAQIVSVYSLTWLAGGLTAPLIGRLFDRSGPRTVYAVGLALLGGAFLAASHANKLWQFQLSIGLCVGIGIAFIGNVPNSILLGRWFGPRLPTAMAVVYSATGAGVLVLLPASQILIDHLGWRGAYQIFGIIALGLLVPLSLLPWRLFSTGSPHVVKRSDPDFVDEGWTLLSAMRHHAFWALFATFFFTAIGMYAISAQIVAYLIDAGFPPLQAATAWGFSGVVLLFGMYRRHATGPHDRSPAVGLDQLCHLDHRDRLALATAMVSELLAAWRLRGYLRQHDRLARATIDGDGDEDLPRRAGRHHLRRHFDRQRARLRVRLLERRADPRLDPQL